MFRQLMTGIPAAACVLACFPLGALAATTIDIPNNFPSGLNNASALWIDPNNDFVAGSSCQGAVCHPITLGQQWGLRFDAPTGNYNLTSVSIAAGMYPSSAGPTAATEFSLALYAWSPILHAPVGAALFSSAPMDLSSPQPDLGFGVEDFRFNMNVPLTGSTDYMLQLVGNGMIMVGTSQFGAPGNLELFQTSPDTPNSNIAKWQDFPMTMVSQVELSAVPEPATWALFIVGFGAIGGMSRFHRRAAQTTVDFRSI